MKSHPTMPMRNTLYRNQVVGKSSDGATYSAVTFHLYWDSSSSDPDENYDFDIQIFEVDSSMNAVRTVLDINEVDLSTATADELIQSSSINLNDVETTDYVIKGSYVESDEGDDAMSSFAWSYYDMGNGYPVSQAPNIEAFDSSEEVQLVTELDQSLTGKTGYTPDITGRYENVIENSSGHGMKFRPGNLTDDIWVWINLT